MPASCSGGMDQDGFFQALIVNQMLENAFRQRGSADVAEANETYFNGFGWGHCIFDLEIKSV